MLWVSSTRPVPVKSLDIIYQIGDRLRKALKSVSRQYFFCAVLTSQVLGVVYMKKGVPDIDTVFAVIMKVAGSFYSLFVCRFDS